MNYLFIISVFAIAIFMGNLIIPKILLVAFRKRLFDIADDRKRHTGRIPRLGGLSFAPTQCLLMAITLFITQKFEIADLHSTAHVIFPQFLLLICGLILLFMIGLVDDLIGVNYYNKFSVQILSASLFPLGGLWINDLYGLFGVTSLSPWVGMPLTVFMVVFITNAINLIDGIDGLCSGLSSITTTILGCLFIYNGAWLHGLFAFITTGVLLSFFYYNVFGSAKRGRKIFMGDTGSLTLGLSISFLVISYAMNDPTTKTFSEGAIVVSFAALIIPIFDVIQVIFTRFRKRRPLFQPDRNHIHHIFLNMGFSHRATMFTILLIALIFSVANIIGVNYISNNIILFLDVILWIGLYIWFDKIQTKQQQKQKNIKKITI